MRITIMVGPEPGAPATVSAYKTPVNGLAVNRQSGGQRWNVTHVASGFAVGTSVRTRAEAIERARKIGPLADWTASQDDLLADRNLGRRVSEAWLT